MWYFRSPEIVFGQDALDHLTQLSGHRAMIVTDPVMIELGFVEQVVKKLEAAGIASQIFSQVEVEPSHHHHPTRRSGHDRVSAGLGGRFGGGSPRGRRQSHVDFMRTRISTSCWSILLNR